MERPMKKCPEISIIVPVYNAADFYERCFGSILRQEFRDFEVIMVDDCSTDGSAELLRRFWPEEAPPLRILRNEQNMGPSLSRNRGIEAARGKYLGFIDHDDAVAPAYLRKLHDLAEREGADYVSCGARTILADGTARQYTANSIVTPGGLPAMKYVEHFHFNLATWGSLLERRIIMEHGLRFTTGAFEDVFFNVRYLMYCRRAVTISDFLYDYHERDTTLSQSVTNADYDYLDSFCTVLSMVEEFTTVVRRELGLSEEDVLRIHTFFLRLSVLRLETTAKKLEKESFEERLNEKLREYFGEHAVYVRAMIALCQEFRQSDQEKHLAESLQYQVNQTRILAKRVEIYDAVEPELQFLYRKQMMINVLLQMEGKPLTLFLEQPWYKEYWQLVAKESRTPGMVRYLEGQKATILAWMEGKEPVSCQFGALALLLAASFQEAKNCMDTSIWPEKLRGDFAVLEAWERLRE